MDPEMTVKEKAGRFAVHSAVRSRFNRTLRAQSPVHHRFKQYLLGAQRRLVRGRPMILSEEELLTHIDELREKVRLGVIEVRTEDGRPFNIQTLTAGWDAIRQVAPHPIPDSIANDIPTGYRLPRYPGEKILTPDQAKEVIEGMAEADGELMVAADGTITVKSEEVAAEETEELSPEDVEETDEAEPGIPPPPVFQGAQYTQGNKQNNNNKKNKFRR